MAFDRSYAEIPAPFDDFSTITYSFPILYPVRMQALTQTVAMRVYTDYFTGNPQGITLSGAQTYKFNGWDSNGLVSATTVPSLTLYSGWVTSGVEIIPQDATISRYLGPIWARETYYVKAK